MRGITDGDRQTPIDPWRLIALERRTGELERCRADLMARVETLERTLAVGTPVATHRGAGAPARAAASVAPSGAPAPPRTWVPTAPRPEGSSAAQSPKASSVASTEASPPAPPMPATTPASAPAPQPPARSAWELTDLLAGRVLAWIGGAAVFIGVLLFLALAVAHGWIGPVARTLLAAGGALALLAAGCWLHERRGRTDAARIAVGCAIASLFATVVVATQVYGLVGAPLGLALSFGVGALAATLAVRWRAIPIAALGIVGALLAPVLVGAGLSAGSVAFVFVAASAAAVVIVWQRWPWLRFAVFACSVPQWAAWLLGGQDHAAALLTLAAFGALGFVVAVGFEVRVRASSLNAPALVLVAANAFALAIVGWAALGGFQDDGSAQAWIAALALAHLLAGGYRGWADRLSTELRHYLLALGVILADVAFGASANGLVLGLGWAAVTLACALRLRRPSAEVARFDAPLLGFGLGAHLGLVLVRALQVAPPHALGGLEPAAMLAVGLLATVSFSSARLLPESAGGYRVVLNALGLVTVAYLTALALSGTALVAAWAVEAVALAELDRRTDDRLAVVASLSFLAGAVVLALAMPGAGVPGSGVAGLDAATLAAGLATMASVRMGIALERRGALRRAVFVLAMLGVAYVSARMVEGVALVAAWALAAIVLGELARRADDLLGVAGALAYLTGAVVLALATPGAGVAFDGAAGLDAATLAGGVATVASAQLGLALGRRAALRTWLFVLAMLGVAYVSARMVDGVALVAAWSVVAVALGDLARRRGDATLVAGALGFLFAAATLATAAFAPPSGLVYGVAPLADAVAALIVVAAACAGLASVTAPGVVWVLGTSKLDGARLRRVLWGAASGWLLYLASLAIVSTFQPAAGVAAADVLDLTVRQQGQLLLSVLWSAVGLVALVLGLRVGSHTVRRSALVLLLVTTAKVFLYDMSTLDSLYRVVSFVVLGLLLLAGAHTWQRLRPRPLSDLREFDGVAR